MKLTDNVYESLATWGKHPVFIELSAEGPSAYHSAADFRTRIDEIKSFLRRAGIRKNSIVALFLKNSADFAAIFFALIDIDAKPIPVNLAFRKMELDEIFSNADPHAIIAESDFLPLVKQYAGERLVVERKNGKLQVHLQGKGAANFKPVDIDDAIASINYTYRGYGYPLGAMVPHVQYLHGAKVLVDGLRPEAGENMLVVLPFTYIFPLIVSLCVPVLYGMTSILSGTVNPLNLYRFISDYKINVITAVPEVYELLYKLKDDTVDVSSLSVLISGGCYLSEEQYRQVKEAFNVVFGQGYGLTEFTPVCRHTRDETRAGTIGPLCEGIECRISSPDDGGAGEITIRTPKMTKAYYLRQEETREAFDGEWFKTGDIGKMENGHLIFVKEKKKTRKVKGNMVDLEEVRRALMTYPNIHDARIEYRHNLLSAGISINSNANFDEEVLNIKKHLESMIARYKIPKGITRL